MIHGRPIHASQVIRPRVRILAQRNPTTAAMATNTAVQTPWVETAFSPMEMPSIADPVTNIQYAECQGYTSVYICKEDVQRQKAAPRTPRPTRPNINAPASSIPYTCGCCSLKVPITQLDHVVITPTAHRQITPGTIPRESNAVGMERTPRPSWVFIMRITVPKNPT